MADREERIRAMADRVAALALAREIQGNCYVATPMLARAAIRYSADLVDNLDSEPVPPKREHT